MNGVPAGFQLNQLIEFPFNKILYVILFIVCVVLCCVRAHVQTLYKYYFFLRK